MNSQVTPSSSRAQSGNPGARRSWPTAPLEGYSLGELADQFKCVVQGNASLRVTHVATLQDADSQAIAFIANAKYLPLLASTQAGAVILSPQHAQESPIPCLVARNPYAVFARVASVLHPPRVASPGVHPSATVDSTAQIAPDVSVGPGCVIEGNVRIDRNVVLGPHCVVMRGSRIGSGTRLIARVTLCADVTVGARCILHPGVVIGSDGFGNAFDEGAWVKIPQLGSVQIGDDVEIGANTTVDRGTLKDTVIENGVRLDNLIQVAHNVRIGAHTAIAAGVGIAGSTTIGKYCVIAGKAGIADQLEICDRVIILAMTAVGRSIDKPGTYSGTISMDEVTKFRRSAARFRQLDEMAKELHRLTKAGQTGQQQSSPAADAAQ